MICSHCGAESPILAAKRCPSCRTPFEKSDESTSAPKPSAAEGASTPVESNSGGSAKKVCSKCSRVIPAAKLRCSTCGGVPVGAELDKKQDEIFRTQEKLAERIAADNRRSGRSSVFDFVLFVLSIPAAVPIVAVSWVTAKRWGRLPTSFLVFDTIVLGLFSYSAYSKNYQYVPTWSGHFWPLLLMTSVAAIWILMTRRAKVLGEGMFIGYSNAVTMLTMFGGLLLFFGIAPAWSAFSGTGQGYISGSVEGVTPGDLANNPPMHFLRHVRLERASVPAEPFADCTGSSDGADCVEPIASVDHDRRPDTAFRLYQVDDSKDKVWIADYEEESGLAGRKLEGVLVSRAPGYMQTTYRMRSRFPENSHLRVLYLLTPAEFRKRFHIPEEDGFSFSRLLADLPDGNIPYVLAGLVLLGLGGFLAFRES